MDRKVFIEKVTAHLLNVVGTDKMCDKFQFTVAMHFGEKVSGVISFGTDYVLVRLTKRYKGWKLALSASSVTDNVGAVSWSNFDLGDIYREISAQQTLEGAVEILLTHMMEW